MTSDPEGVMEKLERVTLELAVLVKSVSKLEKEVESLKSAIYGVDRDEGIKSSIVVLENRIKALEKFLTDIDNRIDELNERMNLMLKIVAGALLTTVATLIGILYAVMSGG